jgi:hypothetical protein
VDISSGTPNVTQVPEDLSSLFIQAVVPDGTGNYTSYSGTGTSAGTFSILDVPTGSYYLQHGSNFDWIQSSTPALGTTILGRSNSVNSSYQPTFNLTGMPTSDPATGTLSWWVPNLPYGGNEGASVPAGITLQSTIGSGELEVTGTAPFDPLMDYTQGDVGYALISTADPGYTGSATVSTVTSLYTDSTIATAANSTPNIGTAGPVTSVNQDTTVEVAVTTRAFTGLRPTIGTTTTPSLNFAVYLDPYSSADGVLAQGPALLTYTTDPTNPWDDVGVPFAGPDQFSFPGTYILRYCVEDIISSTTTAYATPYVLYSCSGTAPSAGSPMTPIVGPVTSPTIDGTAMDLVNVQAVAEDTPTISWSAPSVGTPSYYVVNVAWATFTTTNTSLPVPAGILTTGSATIQITAYYTSSTAGLDTGPGSASENYGAATLSTTITAP